jgi:hypothetical protein
MADAIFHEASKIGQYISEVQAGKDRRSLHPLHKRVESIVKAMVKMNDSISVDWLRLNGAQLCKGHDT